MWIQTTIGSFSIIQTEADQSAGMLTVAAQNDRDLQRLIERFIPDTVLQYSEENSSPLVFIRAPQGVVAAAMAQAVADICYSNFLQTVDLLEGGERAKSYSNIAFNLEQLQHENSDYDFEAATKAGVSPEKVMEIGLENGSVTLWAYRYAGHCGYSVEVNDWSLTLISESDEPENREDFYQEWHQAIRGLPERWVMFSPLYVAEKYWPYISKELRLRGAEPSLDEGWTKARCNPKC